MKKTDDEEGFSIHLCFLNMVKKILFPCFVALLLVLSLTQCRRESFLDDNSARLEFSQDTIFFDTVFSTVGSVTQYLRVRNNYDKTIRIDEIAIEGGTSSQFRINIDGLDGPVQRDIEILPNDSIFIFVEVTIDPGNGSTPFIVEDDIRFTLNDNVQRVHLESYGQNAIFHGGLNSCGNPISEVIESGTIETWDNSLPHVVYGIVMVDAGATLVINPGVQVYCHGKSGIFVNGGNIKINGELGAEVVFQGDRLEPYYQDIPGQWGIQLDCPYETSMGPQIASIVRGGIWIFGSTDSDIKHAILRNGNVGIQVDTTGVSYNSLNYSVDIQNTKIINMAGIGLLGQGATITGNNLLVANCGQQAAYFGLGGRYRMDNCTFGNFNADNDRQTPTFVLNNYYEDVYQNIQVREIYDSQFSNCIMYGNNANLTDYSEFLLDINESGPTNFRFRSCLVDANFSVENDGNRFEGMTNNQAPLLCNPSAGNFRLSSNADIMKGTSVSVNNVSPDLDGNFWSVPVWKGCYAYDSNSPCE